MSEEEINVALAAELTKRSGVEYRDFGDGLWAGVMQGKKFEASCRRLSFCCSYDTLHLLEKLLTFYEWERYGNAVYRCFVRSDRAAVFSVFFIQMSPLDRARVLAQTLRGGE